MKLKFLVTFYLTTLILFQNVIGQQVATVTSETNISIDSFIEQKMKETGIVGLGASIIVDQKFVWAKGYGYADKENKKPFTMSTIMNIGSIAKNFTGVCLMKAVEEKKITLDDDINTYLPFRIVNPFFPNEKITIRNLATHTSSLADRYPFYDSTYLYGAGDSPEDLGEFLKSYFDVNGKYYSKENFLNYKPGTYYQYSNLPAAIAGYIVEIATGKKLNVYGREHIFNPLRMKNTGWFLSEIKLANHTKLYDRSGDTIKPIQLYSFPTYPEGGIRTSVAELSKYFVALLNDGVYNGVRILKKESIQEMQTFQFTVSNKPVNMNVAKLNTGIFWATKMGATRIGHNGSDPGVRTFMLSDLTKEIGIILFVNTKLSEKDEGIYFDIYEELYNYAKELKSAKDTGR